MCDCGGPLLARYEWEDLRPRDLVSRGDMWRYGPLLPLEPSEIRSRGEGGTPLHSCERIGAGGRVAKLELASIHVKDEGRNPTGTFKARGMAVAVPMAQVLGAESAVLPTAGSAGAALAQFAAVYGLDPTIFMTVDAPAEARSGALEFGNKVLEVAGDLSDLGRLAEEYARATGAFNLATLREPYRVEGKKTILLEIWEALGGMPDWILFPTGGGTGIVGAWKALQELRELGWYEGPAPRIGIVQAEGCAPLVEAWRAGKDRADPWKDPRTGAAGLRVPATIGDRLVLQAVRDTAGAGVTVSDDQMAVAVANLATLEGISACPEGAATLAGLRRLHDEGTIRPSDRVVLVNTGGSRSIGRRPDLPRVGSCEEALRALGIRPSPS